MSLFKATPKIKFRKYIILRNIKIKSTHRLILITYAREKLFSSLCYLIIYIKISTLNILSFSVWKTLKFTNVCITYTTIHTYTHWHVRLQNNSNKYTIIISIKIEQFKSEVNTDEKKCSIFFHFLRIDPISRQNRMHNTLRLKKAIATTSCHAKRGRWELEKNC